MLFCKIYIVHNLFGNLRSKYRINRRFVGKEKPKVLHNLWWSSNLRNGWSNQSNDPELWSKGTVKVRIRIDINPASLLLLLLLLFCLDELWSNGLSLFLNSKTVDKSSIGVQQIRFLVFGRVKLFRLFHLFELSFILFDCISL